MPVSLEQPSKAKIDIQYNNILWTGIDLRCSGKPSRKSFTWSEETHTSSLPPPNKQTEFPAEYQHHLARVFKPQSIAKFAKNIKLDQWHENFPVTLNYEYKDGPNGRRIPADELDILTGVEAVRIVFGPLLQLVTKNAVTAHEQTRQESKKLQPNWDTRPERLTQEHKDSTIWGLHDETIHCASKMLSQNIGRLPFMSNMNSSTHMSRKQSSTAGLTTIVIHSTSAQTHHWKQSTIRNTNWMVTSDHRYNSSLQIVIAPHSPFVS